MREVDFLTNSQKIRRERNYPSVNAHPDKGS